MPADENTTADQEAELYFFKGYAELLAGELFVALPAEPNGPALTPEAGVNLTIEDFKKSSVFTTINDRKASYSIALARAYYRLGDSGDAQKYADDAVALNPNYLRIIQFDA
ncbi:hypothetical protein [uncultured Pontibacter sp.]|uniref:hypothetical protein n=1 Tax=uncultured Pontibacter sp. TaxID=453356 RepID=UPI00260E35C3|nr:hypothetical protein [uncultured Pontibacter sp.]